MHEAYSIHIVGLLYYNYRYLHNSGDVKKTRRGGAKQEGKLVQGADYIIYALLAAIILQVSHQSDFRHHLQQNQQIRTNSWMTRSTIHRPAMAAQTAHVIMGASIRSTPSVTWRGARCGGEVVSA